LKYVTITLIVENSAITVFYGDVPVFHVFRTTAKYSQYIVFSFLGKKFPPKVFLFLLS